MMRLIDRAPQEYTLSFRKGVGEGVTEVLLLPSNNRLKEGGVDLTAAAVDPKHLLTFDRKKERFAIHPFYTRPSPDGEFEAKRHAFKTVWFDWLYPSDTVDEGVVYDALGWYDQTFQVDPDYGLGIKQGYRMILRAVLELSDAKEIYIGEGQPDEGQFALIPGMLQSLTSEIDRIDARAKTAENEVKLTTAHNMLAMMRGEEPRPFRLGRNKIRNLIQSYAADPNFTDPEVQEQLVLKVAEAASTFAQRNPNAADALVSDLQLTRLETALAEFKALMGKHQNENIWQSFFEGDPFLLSFAFGYPVVCVNGQSYVGGRRIDGKGEKIGDFLYKNSVNNNAALIEIKKPQSQVVKKYRDGVYGPHEELSGGVTQLLDQRHHFARRFPLHKADNDWHGEDEVADYQIDCVLIVGTMPENRDERRSFQLYRKNSHDVRIVTFDEVLAMLDNLLDYLQSANPTYKSS